MVDRLRFGAFIAPFHDRGDNPSLALHRSLELVELLDRLGYDEVWIGEHHSAAYETIGSPEMFIATAAERSRSIRLGTGVVSLPYHSPLMLAERINYLDHVTRGRVMFGVGPGALPSDALMMGIPILKQRPRMDEALDVLIRLLRGEEVSAETEWFKLFQARLQMVPWTRPCVEMAVASLVSPSGATAAGRHGIGLLSFQALGGEAFNSLAKNWAIAEQVAAEHGKRVDRSKWRLVVQMHIAETREQAIRDCRFGLEKWIWYYQHVAQLPIVPDGVTGEDLVRTYADMDVAVIGTPDDAIAAIERLQEQTGGFGCFMLLAHDWANSRATADSYELVARYVMPHFQKLNVNREASLAWVLRNRPQLAEQQRQAIANRFVEHAARHGVENLDAAKLREFTAPGSASPVKPTIFKGMGPASRRVREARGDRRLPSDTLVVSADNHWAISEDIFYERFPARLKHAAPKLYRSAEGGYLFTIHGEPLLPALQSTIFAEMDSVPGSTQLEARLKDMEVEGIDKELVFGNVVAAFYTYPDLEAREWIYRIYNEYIAEMQSRAPGRFYGVGLLNYWDLSKTRESLDQIKSLGLKTFVIPQYPKGANREPLNYCLDEWRPFWEAVEEAGLPVCFHVGEQLQEGPGGCGVSMMLNFAPFRKSMSELIFGGILDRHPSLRAVFVEGDINWIPGALQTADMVYEAYAHEIQPRIEHPPRYYWEKNLYATFVSDPAGLRLIDEIGADRVMWSNDYPHQESVYGASWTAMQQVIDAVSEADARKILGGTALELFGLD